MKTLIRIALVCALSTLGFAQDMGGPPPSGAEMGGPPPDAMGGPPPDGMGAPPPPDANGAPPPPEADFGAQAPESAPVAAQQDNSSNQNSQQAPQVTPENGQRMRGQGMRGHGTRGVMGEITAVNADGFTIKTAQGNSATVKVSSETKFLRDRDPIKMSDLKVGNTIGVSGTPDPNDPTTWNANFVVDRTAQAKEFKENMGKTMIVGEVKSIDGTNLTILRPDGVTQTISVDENTSFHKARESVTLADIKAGDHVMGRGSVKNGVFVPTELHVGGPGMGMGMGGGRGRGWGGQGQASGQGQGQNQGQGTGNQPPQ